jgi:hypothetical protein
MTRSSCIINRLTQLLALMVLCACSSTSRPQEPAITPNDKEIRRATAAVDDYIVASKQWQKDSYEITLNRKEGETLVFWVLRSEGRASGRPEAGTSVEVYVDPTNNRILKELAFQ